MADRETHDAAAAYRGEASAWEVVGASSSESAIVFTCEHATRLLPEWRADPSEERLLAEHWGWDIGAADLTRALAQRTGCPAVLSRFSRLVCDPNRHPSEASFVVGEVEGWPLSFNRGVDAAERARRDRRYAAPYHDAIDRLIRERRRHPAPFWLCSIHSFTPVYLGRARAMEIGVLFDDYDEQAFTLQEALVREGFETVLNAPYSGRDGLIHAARRHGRAHEIVYLELEVRQDLIAEPAAAREVAERIARALTVVDPSGA